MSEINANNEVVNDNPTAEESVNKPQADTPKTFTQDELDKIVADRISRERKKLEKFADYDDLKTKASEYEKALEEKRLAELSAQERAEELAKKFEAERNDFAKKLEELQSQAQREKVVNAFIKAAPGVNIPADRIDAALKLADLSAETVGENGVEGLDAVMSALGETYGFLAETKKPQKPIGEPSNSPKDTADKTNDQLLQEAADKVKRTQSMEAKVAYAALKAKLGK